MNVCCSAWCHAVGILSWCMCGGGQQHSYPCIPQLPQQLPITASQASIAIWNYDSFLNYADMFHTWNKIKSTRDFAYFTVESRETVLRIHDILVWIRIRGSMPMTCGSGSCYFHHWPSKRQQKTNFNKKFFCILLFEGTFTSIFEDKKSKRSH